MKGVQMIEITAYPHIPSPSMPATSLWNVAVNTIPEAFAAAEERSAPYYEIDREVEWFGYTLGHGIRQPDGTILWRIGDISDWKERS